ncbi:MAG: hypothetical protein WAZ12_05410 [Candidatus Absconditicoccaceae bacterium]
MIVPEIKKFSNIHLDHISQIREDAKNGIETIFLPSIENINRCYFNNKLLTQEEAVELSKTRKIKMTANTGEHKFFIHHKSLGIIPFEKGDFIMDDLGGYRTTDGTYIFPYDEKGKDANRHYFNNKLLSKKEAIEFAHTRNIKIAENIDKHHFFVYHEHLGIVPFQKGDIVMTDEGYSTTDGEHVLCYDNNGNELGFF